MKVYRSDKSKGFTTGFTSVDNGYLHNPNLSQKAKGLFTFLLSLHEDMNPSIKFIQSKMSDKYSSIRSSLNELIENGYIDEVEVSKDLKHLRYYDYTLYENGKDEVYSNSTQGMQKINTGYAENPNLITTNIKYKAIYIRSSEDLILVQKDLIANINQIIDHLELNSIIIDVQEFNRHIREFISYLSTTDDYNKSITDYRKQFINHMKYKFSYGRI